MTAIFMAFKTDGHVRPYLFVSLTFFHEILAQPFFIA